MCISGIGVDMDGAEGQYDFGIYCTHVYSITGVWWRNSTSQLCTQFCKY